jgi:hypothetical protein
MMYKLALGVIGIVGIAVAPTVMAQDRVRNVQIQNRPQLEQVETAERVEMTETSSPSPSMPARPMMGERVREMAQELAESEDRTGGIGERVREIARTQVQRAERAEEMRERIKTRSNWQRRIWGGDYEAAKELRFQVQANLEELEILKEEASSITDADELALVNELIQGLEENTENLKAEAESEESSRGIFGFLRRLFSR